LEVTYVSSSSLVTPSNSKNHSFRGCVLYPTLVTVVAMTTRRDESPALWEQQRKEVRTMTQRTMTQETRASAIDELAKGLASGTISRRKALRLMGAALVGGSLASIPGVALAANPCPSPRIKCRGTCCADGVTTCQGTGSDQTCGPAPVVCPTGQEECGSACCQSGETCLNGDCCPSTQVCGSVCCPSGQTCVNGTCSSSPPPGGECTVWDNEGQHTVICPSGYACCPDVGCYDPNAGQHCCTNDGGFNYICQVGVDCECPIM